MRSQGAPGVVEATGVAEREALLRQVAGEAVERCSRAVGPALHATGRSVAAAAAPARALTAPPGAETGGDWTASTDIDNSTRHSSIFRHSSLLALLRGFEGVVGVASAEPDLLLLAMLHLALPEHPTVAQIDEPDVVVLDFPAHRLGQGRVGDGSQEPELCRRSALCPSAGRRPRQGVVRATFAPGKARATLAESRSTISEKTRLGLSYGLFTPFE